jgi:hypothetical protein
MARGGSLAGRTCGIVGSSTKGLDGILNFHPQGWIRKRLYSILTLAEPTPMRFVATSRTVATNRMLPLRDLTSPV